MTDLFVSYSRDDTVTMQVIRDNLRKLGFNLWIDIEHLKPGTPKWERAIEKSIRSVDGLILLMSPTSKESPWVQREIILAQQVGLPIFPVLIGGDLLDSVPFRLLEAQYADMRGRENPAAGFVHLVDGLAGHFGLTLPEYEFGTLTDHIPSIQVVNVTHHHEGNVVNISGDVVVEGDFVAGDQVNEEPSQPETIARVTPSPSPRRSPQQPRTSRKLNPLWIGGGVVAVMAVIGLIAFSGRGSGEDPVVTEPPVVSEVNAQEPAPTSTEEPEATATNQPTPTQTAEPTATATLSPGERARALAEAGVSSNDDWTSYTEVINGVEMALVPAGCFMMGSTEYSDEQPVHEVCFEEPFWIDLTEVTNGQFYDDPGMDFAERPRISVNWNTSLAHCESRGARLPTEAEWEYAARGPDALIYPWGNTFIGDNVVYSSNSGSQTADVGSRPGGASWVGALDLSGNVWEWVNDWYDADYYDTLADGVVNPQGPGTGSSRVLRGGSWNYDPSTYFRGAFRNWFVPSLSVNYYGFRCALSYSP